jgi:uncharacterized membrane protein
MKSALQWLATLSLVALVALCLAWELWLAPLRAGGSALAFKALPLLLPLFGVLRGRRYTYQWAWLLGLAYFTEGVVRGWSERGTSQMLAFAEIALSLTFFTATVFFARITGGKAAAHGQ